MVIVRLLLFLLLSVYHCYTANEVYAGICSLH